MLAGTDAGTGVRDHVGVWDGGDSTAQSHSMGGGQRESEGTYTGTHTQRNVHANAALTLSDLPLKKCPEI